MLCTLFVVILCTLFVVVILCTLFVVVMLCTLFVVMLCTLFVVPMRIFPMGNLGRFCFPLKESNRVALYPTPN